MNARQQSILQVVIDKGRMSVADLAKMTGVSEVTIRQDLNLLEKQSYLRRTHGYAVPLDSEDVETRMKVHFSKAFIGIDGWQAETGFTGRDMMRADVVNAVLEKHCEAIILSDSSKFSAVHPYPLGPAGRFNRVITDDRLPDACREQLLRSGLTVDIVPYI